MKRWHLSDTLNRPLHQHQSQKFLFDFQSIAPRFRTSQEELLDKLVDAHVSAGGGGRSDMASRMARYSASSEQIASRAHEVEDFIDRTDIGEKTRFFEERVADVFRRFYAERTTPPSSIVHVTCTGYTSPSGAQKVVSERDWGKRTQVVHAYHMGCYAAHPSVRMAAGLAASALEGTGAIDIVHTELCSLHLDAAQHDPGSLVIQSLFADGFIKYSLSDSLETDSQGAGLEILSACDEIIPDSTEAMVWWTGPMNFAMKLSKDVPILLASALPRFVKRLFDEAGLDEGAEKGAAMFAVHPGGPRIIELSQRILGLESEQVRHSRQVLFERGNMSSATLPHIWEKILLDSEVPEGTLVVSLGAGPGLTLSGIVFRKR